MPDPRDYNLDLSSLPQAPPELPSDSTAHPYIGVHFACCNFYLRIYRSPDGKHYNGRCPGCGVAVHFAVGEGGTDARTFVVR